LLLRPSLLGLLSLLARRLLLLSLLLSSLSLRLFQFALLLLTNCLLL
jgi:hypothetical protein